MCCSVNGYEALLGFGGVQLGWGWQVKAGSQAEGMSVCFFLGKVFAHLADPAGRMTQLWGRPGGPMQDSKPSE
jgi:hypothetical protein